MVRFLRNPLIVINSVLFVFLSLVIIQRTVDVTGAPVFVQNVFAAVANITGEGSVNQVAAFSSTNTIGNSILFDNGSRVGVGNTNPTQTLDSNGFVKGRSGLCIGDDCRSAWPAGGGGGDDMYYCSRLAVTRGNGCAVNGIYEDSFVVSGVDKKDECFDVAVLTDFYNTDMEVIFVGINQTNSPGLYDTGKAHDQRTCIKGQSCTIPWNTICQL